ncbi:peptidase domain-containing ABC transporter [Simkania sp.]|uniref:peptidase domain-containing ABC transporter n=1 Tax=Simkania sp. TaxID=34094 RepID=UPI003B523E22
MSNFLKKFGRFFSIGNPSSWRVRTPLLLQMEAIECGAASLGIILGYYRKFLPLRELRHRCAVSRDGSSVANLIEAAKFYGLKGTGMRTMLFHLEKHKKPAILLWRGSHFVVLEEIKKNKVYINDPEHGPIVYTKEEFQSYFSGIAIFFEFTENFERSPFRLGLLRRFKDEWRNHSSTHLFLLISGLLLLLPTLVVPIILRIFINHMHYSNVIEWKIESLGFLTFAIALGAALTAFHSFFLKKISHKISENIASRHLFQLMKFPLTFFGQRDPREMAQRIEELGKLSQSYYEEVIPTFIQLILSLFYAAIMFTYSPLVSSVTLLGAILSLLIMQTVSRSRLALYDTWERARNQSEEASLEQMHSIDAIKAAGSEQFFFKKWIKHYTYLLNTDQTIGKKERLLLLFPFFIKFFSTALLIGIGTHQILYGKLSLGTLAALQIYLILFLAPLGKFLSLTEKINQMRRNVCRVNDLTHTPTDKFFTLEREKKSPINTLEFQDVSHSYYPHAPPLLKNISFALNAYECIGITGPTRSGKSTLGKLAAALYHPSKGKILYGGNSLEEIDPKFFRKSIAWIGDENIFFLGSLRNNLTFWNHDITEETLHEVGEKIGSSLQLDRWIMEEGKNLSRSEKQELDLARIFLKNPSLLIIDHGLYALPHSQQEKLIEELRKVQCSLLCITYDSFLLDKCDKVLHLDQGELV